MSESNDALGFSPFYSKLVGTGSALPETIWTNADLERLVDTNDEWIRTRTGIEQRRIVDPKLGESTFSLSEKAARQALEMSGLSASDVGLIVVGTVTPDTIMPNTANYLQQALGASRAFGFDLQAACSGFMYGLSVADSYIRSGQVSSALVVGAETLSTIVDWKDRSTCVLFGDAAGAAVLQRTQDPERSILGCRVYSDGRFGHILSIPHGHSKVPPYSAEYRANKATIQMAGSEVFKLAVRSMVEASQDLLKEKGFAAEQVDQFIFHQANIRIIDMCIKTLGIDPAKAFINVQRYGNTSAATLPVCLDEAVRGGKIRPGNLVLASTFGGGVTWGSALIRF